MEYNDSVSPDSSTPHTPESRHDLVLDSAKDLHLDPFHDDHLHMAPWSPPYPAHGSLLHELYNPDDSYVDALPQSLSHQHSLPTHLDSLGPSDSRSPPSSAFMPLADHQLHDPMHGSSFGVGGPLYCEPMTMQEMHQQHQQQQQDMQNSLYAENHFAMHHHAQQQQQQQQPMHPHALHTSHIHSPYGQPPQLEPSFLCPPQHHGILGDGPNPPGGALVNGIKVEDPQPPQQVIVPSQHTFYRPSSAASSASSASSASAGSVGSYINPMSISGSPMGINNGLASVSLVQGSGHMNGMGGMMGGMVGGMSMNGMGLGPMNGLAGMNPHGLTAIPIQHTDDAASKETQYLRRRCYNCHTTEPPSWRRSTLHPGKIVCNKCGLYERTHMRARPHRFDELRAGGKARKGSTASQTSKLLGNGPVNNSSGARSPKDKSGVLVKKEPGADLEFEGLKDKNGDIQRRGSVSASSVHSGCSDLDDNVSVYSSTGSISGPGSSYGSPMLSTFPIPRVSQSPPMQDDMLNGLPGGGIRLPNAPLHEIGIQGHSQSNMHVMACF